MATVYGAWQSGVSYRSVLVYTLTDNGTSVTINTTLKVEIGEHNIYGFNWTGTTAIGTGSGSTASHTYTYTDYRQRQTYTLFSHSRTYNKTGADQTIAISGKVAVEGATGSTASVNVTVAKMTYPVTYDVNGGDSATTPASQTKVYNATLTLTTTVPKRTGCTFLGWNTKNDGTGTHYPSGGSYTLNEALKLYAMWLGTSVPTVECERTDAQGEEADEGTYGSVQASWQALGTVTASIAVTARNVTAESAITLDGDTTGSLAAGGTASGNVSSIFGGTLSADVRYTVTVTVTATTTYNGGSTVSSTATAYVNLAYITIDVLAGGHGVAFGKTANREGFDVAMSPLYFSEPPTHDTDLTTAVAANVVTANSGVTTIDSAQARRWGKVCQLYINWKNVAAITVPASGNISNVTVGTVAEGLRPAILTAAHSYGDSAGAAWYYLNSQGNISLGAMEGTGVERTIAAGTTFNFLCTFILP